MMQDKLRDGIPCDHVGCLSHLTHPCEGCGRVGGVSNREIKLMICDLCNYELHPLDAHMGPDRDGNLMNTHIDCWNEYYKDEIAKEKEESK